MERIVVDVITGEVTIVQVTEEEIAEIQAKSSEKTLPPSPPTLAELQAQLNVIQAQIQALSGGQ